MNNPLIHSFSMYFYCTRLGIRCSTVIVETLMKHHIGTLELCMDAERGEEHLSYNAEHEELSFTVSTYQAQDQQQDLLLDQR